MRAGVSCPVVAGGKYTLRDSKWFELIITYLTLTHSCWYTDMRIDQRYVWLPRFEYLCLKTTSGPGGLDFSAHLGLVGVLLCVSFEARRHVHLPDLG